MANKHILMFVALLAILFAGNATAQNIDRVVMSSGSEYEGYIAEQVPGKYISINSTKAILFIDSSSIKQMDVVTHPVDCLIEPMKSWVATNLPDKQEVELASIHAGSKYYKNLLVLEKGVRIKALQLANDSFKVNWKNVVKTSKIATSKMKLHEVVSLKSGKSLSGHIIEQIIGKELRIKQFNGDITSIAFSEVLSIRTELDPKLDNAWAYIPLLDRLELVDGSMVEGLITARVMGSHVYIISPKDSIEREIKTSNIKKYIKVINQEAVIIEESATQDINKTNIEGTDDGNYDSVTHRDIINNESMSESSNNQSPDMSKAPINMNTEPEKKVITEEVKVDTTTYSEIRINNMPISLSDYQVIERGISKYFTTANNIIALTSPINCCYKLNEPVNIEIPQPYDISMLRIVLTTERTFDIMVSEKSSGTYPSFKIKDADRSTIGYSTATTGNCNIITFVPETVGIYVLYPETSNNKYIAFKIID